VDPTSSCSSCQQHICTYLLPKGGVPKQHRRVLCWIRVESIFGSFARAAPRSSRRLPSVDLNTGKRVCSTTSDHSLGAVIGEGGDLLFAVEADRSSGRSTRARGINLELPAPAGVIGIPTSFEVDGEQYIAAPLVGTDAAGRQNGITRFEGRQRCSKAGTVLSFKLRKA